MEFNLDSAQVITLTRLSLALAAGAFIGLERTYHGRPAGFRTHALVCTASSLLVLVTVFYQDLIPNANPESIRLDPTRMAQGIMTGIGFLGAGAIIKDRLAVRGLTTAASIWITAAIGVTIGMGLYFAALVAEVFVLGTLYVFRLVESRMRPLLYARLTVRSPHDDPPSEEELAKVIANHNITGTDPSYQLADKVFRYDLTIRTHDPKNFRDLALTLRDMEQVEFNINVAGN